MVFFVFILLQFCSYSWISGFIVLIKFENIISSFFFSFSSSPLFGDSNCMYVRLPDLSQKLLMALKVNF